MLRQFHWKLTAGIILLAGFIPAGFIFGQRPLAEWLSKPGGIGIVRLSNIREHPPVVLFTSPDLSTAYDTITFHEIYEPLPPVEDFPEKIIAGWITDPETCDSIPLYLSRVPTLEEELEIERKRHEGNRTGAWEFRAAITDVRPMNWFEGHADYDVSYFYETGLARLQPEMTFRAVRDLEQWCEVVVNEDSQVTAYMLKNQGIDGSPNFISWEDYLTNAARVWFNPTEVNVYTKPDERAPFLYMDISGVRIRQVRGQWALIEGRVMDETVKLGWIKWHDGENVFVNVLEFYWI